MYRARSTPYGDIYTIPTTTVDNIANRFVLEQKQRQAQQASESKALDDMFGKNISGMRDEDIPEYTQAYQDYKQAKIGLLNNNKLSGNARIQAELDAQGKLAKTFQILNNSKETQKGLLDIKKRVDNKPDDHVDDAFAMVGAANGIPSSQLHTLTRPDPNGEIDPSTGKIKIVPYDATDYNNYLDRGNVKNWIPIIAKAVGTKKSVNTISKPYTDKSGLELGKEVTPIEATESPVNYMGTIGSVVQNGVGVLKHYNNTFKQNYPDDKAQQIIADYKKESETNPLWKQAWGEKGVNIPPEALINPQTRVLALNAMDYALNHPPTLGKPSNVPNPVNVNAQKQQFAIDQQARGYENAKKLAGVRFGYSTALKDYTAGVDAKSDESVLNKFVSQTYDAGQKNIKSISLGGQQYTGRVVDIPKSIKDQYVVDKGYSSEAVPDAWYMTDDKTKIIPLFYGDKTASGNRYLNSNPNSKPIDIQNFKVDLGKLLLTQKQRGGEVTDQFGDTPPPTSTGKKPTVKKGKYD